MSLNFRSFVLLLSACVASQAIAGGPFGLFNRNNAACDSACDAFCDTQPGCIGDCDGIACTACDGIYGCDGGCGVGCDSACDSGCDSMGCRSKSSVCSSGSGSYCSIFLGGNFLDDYSGEGPSATPPGSDLLGTFGDGWGIGVAKGKRFADLIRAEAEFTFRSNNADVWSVNGTASRWYGHVYVSTVMANIVCELGEIMDVTPYVGGGLGVALLEADLETAMSQLNLDDESFAAQFIAGLSAKVGPNRELYSEYRYINFSDFDLQNVSVAPAADLNGDDVGSHTMMMGFRFFR